MKNLKSNVHHPSPIQKSSSSDRGKRAFENLSRVSSSISKRRQHEISDKDGREEVCILEIKKFSGNEFVAQQQFLPKLPPKRREEVRTNDKERRFRVDKVRMIFIENLIPFYSNINFKQYLNNIFRQFPFLNNIFS